MNRDHNITLDDIISGKDFNRSLDRLTYKSKTRCTRKDLLANKTLTLDHLINWGPCIFKFGESIEKVYPYSEINIRWIAKRGSAVDWIIYFGPKEWSWDYILANGDVMLNQGLIQELVRCDFEAFEMYRK